MAQDTEAPCANDELAEIRNRITQLEAENRALTGRAKRRGRMQALLVVLATSALLASAAFADTAGSISYTDVNSGDPITAAGMNSRFQSVYTQMNELLARIQIRGTTVEISNAATVGGRLSADELSVGGGARITRMESGALGQCYTGGVPAAGTGGRVMLTGGWSNATHVFLQADDDASGCTHALLNAASIAAIGGFDWSGFRGTSPHSCACIRWLAIDPI